MKTRFTLALATMLVAPYTMATAAMAFDYPKKAYDATYEMVNPQGKSEMRMASDGNGMTLTKTEMSGQKTRMITDFKKGEVTTLLDTAKMAMKAKMTEATAQSYEDDWYKKKKAKSLGTKVVNGHPSHGWEYSQDGTTSQTWIGDDCKLMTQSTTDSKYGKTTMNLKKIGPAPAATEFSAAVPAGYKLMTQ
ncbi:MAG: DUF2092 domain-containing protein [Cyanobacteria bacterium TGS_CYA1]|nr:DUF2092 domain-containing protein [Cyanobacteria bacterium TGS_CYA1]